MLESWTIDVRHVVRRLLGHPSCAVLAVLTLALGTGGAAAIYSVVRPLLIDPLPYSNEDDRYVDGTVAGRSSRSSWPGHLQRRGILASPRRRVPASVARVGRLCDTAEKRPHLDQRVRRHLNRNNTRGECGETSSTRRP
jgi:hypothetical protein